MTKDQIEELLVLLESTANMMRGMTMDPSIPDYVKGALWSRINTIDKATERFSG